MRGPFGISMVSMKKLLIAFPLFVLILPASASAYSFETERMEEFRDEVRQINRDRNDPTSKADKATLIATISASASSTKDTFVPVRDAEIVRLDKILSDRLAAVRKASAKNQAALITALNKQCTRQKRNKSEAQKKAIEARCEKRRNAISSSMAAKLEKQEASIQDRFGANSQPREILQNKYNRAITTVDELLAESTESINERPLPSYVLTVARTGAGTGSVVSDPSGINCGLDCSGSYTEDTVVTLTATAADGSQFAGWSGVSGCSTQNTCSVTVNDIRSVTATFNTGT